MEGKADGGEGRPAAPGATERELEQTLSELDQTHADGDQTAADGDQDASVADAGFYAASRRARPSAGRRSFAHGITSPLFGPSTWPMAII